MNLNEAIQHCKEKVIELSECNKNCSDEHYQLMNWLISLKRLSKQRDNVIEYLLNEKLILEHEIKLKQKYSVVDSNLQIVRELNGRLLEINKILEIIEN
ncbi:hypothetical protein [Clostridium perfringens]|uniref:hypothetical protein n=1 Tax=Clostridium perfringens TaxID=1502 RepID=UPI003F43DFFD